MSTETESPVQNVEDKDLIKEYFTEDPETGKYTFSKQGYEIEYYDTGKVKRIYRKPQRYLAYRNLYTHNNKYRYKTFIPHELQFSKEGTLQKETERSWLYTHKTKGTSSASPYVHKQTTWDKQGYKATYNQWDEKGQHYQRKYTKQKNTPSIYSSKSSGAALPTKSITYDKGKTTWKKEIEYSRMDKQRETTTDNIQGTLNTRRFVTSRDKEIIAKYPQSSKINSMDARLLKLHSPKKETTSKPYNTNTYLLRKNINPKETLVPTTTKYYAPNSNTKKAQIYLTPTTTKYYTPQNKKKSLLIKKYPKLTPKETLYYSSSSTFLYPPSKKSSNFGSVIIDDKGNLYQTGLISEVPQEKSLLKKTYNYGQKLEFKSQKSTGIKRQVLGVGALALYTATSYTGSIIHPVKTIKSSISFGKSIIKEPYKTGSKIKEQIVTSPLSFVGGLAASYALGKTIQYGIQKAPSVKYVTVTTPKGKATVWKGFSVEWGKYSQPLVGKTKTGYAIGTPNIKLRKSYFPTEGGKGFTPTTPTEAKIYSRVAKNLYSKTEQQKINLGLEIARGTEKTTSKFLQKKFKKDIKSLSPEGVNKVIDFAKKENAEIYGSFGARQQMQNSRTPGDIDVQLKVGKDTAAIKTQQLVNDLKKIGETARISKQSPLLIETKTGKEWHHAVDIHAIDDTTYRPQDQIWGLKLDQKPIKVEGVDVMRLSEQGVRKGGSILSMKQQGVSPAPHRLKDIPDFFETQKVLIDSKLIGKSILRAKLEKLQSLYPENLRSTTSIKIQLTSTSQANYGSSPSISPSLNPSSPSISPSFKSSSPSISPSFKSSSPSISPSFKSSSPSISPSFKSSSPNISPSLKSSYPILTSPTIQQSPPDKSQGVYNYNKYPSSKKYNSKFNPPVKPPYTPPPKSPPVKPPYAPPPKSPPVKPPYAPPPKSPPVKPPYVPPPKLMPPSITTKYSNPFKRTPPPTPNLNRSKLKLSKKVFKNPKTPWKGEYFPSIESDLLNIKRKKKPKKEELETGLFLRPLIR